MSNRTLVNDVDDIGSAIRFERKCRNSPAFVGYIHVNDGWRKPLEPMLHLRPPERQVGVVGAWNRARALVDSDKPEYGFLPRSVGGAPKSPRGFRWVARPFRLELDAGVFDRLIRNDPVDHGPPPTLYFVVAHALES